MTDREIIEVVLRDGLKPSIKRLRRHFGIGYNRAKRIIELLRGASNNVRVSGDERAISVESVGRIRTLDELLDAAQVDRKRWIVEHFTVNSWEGPAKDGGVQQFFQVKARLRQSIAAAIEEAVRSLSIEPCDCAPVEPHGEHLLVVSVADAHIGKYAWAPEAGDNYDVHIAKRLYVEAALSLVDRASRFGDIGKILFVVGNDLLHIDSGVDSTTTAGTRVDSDGRWQKAYRAALEAVIESIERMAQLAPVDVVIQPGNHDTEKAQTLGIALEMRYANAPHVKIINTPHPRNYYLFGKVLLGITHGDRVDLKLLPSVMAKEARREWGLAEWHEWLLGHFHAKREVVFLPTLESGGVRIRVLPSLSAADAWHTRQGYHSIRASEAILYHPEDGYVATVSYNVKRGGD